MKEHRIHVQRKNLRKEWKSCQKVFVIVNPFNIMVRTLLFLQSRKLRSVTRHLEKGIVKKTGNREVGLFIGIILVVEIFLGLTYFFYQDNFSVFIMILMFIIGFSFYITASYLIKIFPTYALPEIIIKFVDHYSAKGSIKQISLNRDKYFFGRGVEWGLTIIGDAFTIIYSQTQLTWKIGPPDNIILKIIIEAEAETTTDLARFILRNSKETWNIICKRSFSKRFPVSVVINPNPPG